MNKTAIQMGYFISLLIFGLMIGALQTEFYNNIEKQTEGTFIEPIQKIDWISPNRKCDYNEMRYVTLVGDKFCMIQVYLYEPNDFNRIIEPCVRSYMTEWTFEEDPERVSLECVFIYKDVHLEYKTAKYLLELAEIKLEKIKELADNKWNTEND